MMVGVGLLSFLAQILLTVSLQLEEAGKVSIMRKAGDILFAFLFQILIFNVSTGLVIHFFTSMDIVLGASRDVEYYRCQPGVIDSSHIQYKEDHRQSSRRTYNKAQISGMFLQEKDTR